MYFDVYAKIMLWLFQVSFSKLNEYIINQMQVYEYVLLCL